MAKPVKIYRIVTMGMTVNPESLTLEVMLIPEEEGMRVTEVIPEENITTLKLGSYATLDTEYT